MSPEPSAPTDLVRFDRTVRVVHRTVAGLMIVAIFTGAVLYNSSLSLGIGNRRLFEIVHVYTGFLLPIPILIGFGSRAYRGDLRRLNRFTAADWRWLQSRSRRDGRIRVGKFNAGQKLNAALAAGSIVVLLGTGVLMYFTGLVRLSWRSGATFVHDWFALGLGLLVLGHIWFALKDAQARRGMREGAVTRAWAKAEHADWAAEFDQRPTES